MYFSREVPNFRGQEGHFGGIREDKWHILGEVWADMLVERTNQLAFFWEHGTHLFLCLWFPFVCDEILIEFMQERLEMILLQQNAPLENSYFVDRTRGRIVLISLVFTQFLTVEEQIPALDSLSVLPRSSLFRKWNCGIRESVLGME